MSLSLRLVTADISGSCFTSGISGQCEIKCCATFRVIFCPHFSGVSLDDIVADRQTHAHAFDSRGKKGLEDALQIFRRDTASAIFDLDANTFVTGRHRADENDPVLRRIIRHGMTGVRYRVEQNLLKLNAVSLDRKSVV